MTKVASLLLLALIAFDGVVAFAVDTDLSKSPSSLLVRKSTKNPKKNSKKNKNGKTDLKKCGEGGSGKNGKKGKKYDHKIKKGNKKSRGGAFNRVSSFLICSQIDPTCNTDIETSVEHVTASDDGMVLVYSDSDFNVVGMIDISDPALPVGLGVVDVGGEPTSIGVVGGYAVSSVDTSINATHPSAVLVVIEIASGDIVATHDLGGQTDGLAVSPDAQFVTVAVENEREEDVPGQDGEAGLGVPPAGYVIVFDSSASDPTEWVPSIVNVTGLEGINYADDPEPEKMDINAENMLVLTLQENNGIIIIDLPSLTVVKSLSAGKVSLTLVDTDEDNVVNMDSDLLDQVREPDGIAWISNSHFATADEGDLNGGGRGYTIWNTAGEVVYTSGNEMEHLVARIGHYPEGRSGSKGNEPDQTAFGIFEGVHTMFVNSERSSVIAVYDVSDPANPMFLQVLPAVANLKGSRTVPSRGLFVAASQKDDRDKKLRAAVNIYEYSSEKPQYPTLVSADRENGTPIPWGALSGLVAASDGYLYAVEDNTYRKSRIFKINPDTYPAVIEEEIRIMDSSSVLASAAPNIHINDDMTVDLDPEGIAIDDDGNFWVAHEGQVPQEESDDGSSSSSSEDPVIESFNMLLHVTPDGTIVNVITLPEELNEVQQPYGFQGVAYNEGKLVVTMQRAWGEEDEPRIAVYHLVLEKWEFYFYPLDVPLSQNGGWVGLFDIAPLGGDQYLVLEGDDQAGPDGVIKTITMIDLSGVAAGSKLEKTLVIDLVPELLSTGGLLIEKMAGLAVTDDGSVWVVNDNAGTNDNSGETQLMELECVL